MIPKEQVAEILQHILHLLKDGEVEGLVEGLPGLIDLYQNSPPHAITAELKREQFTRFCEQIKEGNHTCFAAKIALLCDDGIYDKVFIFKVTE